MVIEQSQCLLAHAYATPTGCNSLTRYFLWVTSALVYCACVWLRFEGIAVLFPWPVNSGGPRLRLACVWLLIPICPQWVCVCVRVLRVCVCNVCMA